MKNYSLIFATIALFGLFALLDVEGATPQPTNADASPKRDKDGKEMAQEVHEPKIAHGGLLASGIP